MNIEIQKDDIILANSVALVDGFLKTLQKMRLNPIVNCINEAEEVPKKLALSLFCNTKRIPKRKKHSDEMCEDDLQTLLYSSLSIHPSSKEVMVVFDRLI